jgi:hypothetical protein
VRVRISPGLPSSLITESGLEWSGNCLENSATVMNREGSIPSLSAKFMLGCSWESRWLPNPSHGVRIVARVPVRKRRLKVWQRFAKPPVTGRERSSRSASARVRVSGRYGIAAAVCKIVGPCGRPSSNLGAPTIFARAAQLVEAADLKSAQGWIESDAHQYVLTFDCSPNYTRAVPPREVKAKFVEPMLLLPAETLPEGAGWAYELLCGRPHKSSSVV